jgi:hypothetical protein
MITTFDTDKILFSLLDNSIVKYELNGGGIYLGNDRPNDSDKDDIVINTIDLTQEYAPQLGTSNVNIYVADKEILINGKMQLKADRQRLKFLSELVLKVLRNANIDELELIPSSQTILDETSIKQHYVNIRIDWNIQTIN